MKLEKRGEEEGEKPQSYRREKTASFSLYIGAEDKDQSKRSEIR